MGPPQSKSTSSSATLGGIPRDSPDHSHRAAHNWQSLEGIGFPFVPRAPAAGDLTATDRGPQELCASVSLMAVYTTRPHIDVGRVYRWASVSTGGGHFDGGGAGVINRNEIAQSVVARREWGGLDTCRHAAGLAAGLNDAVPQTRAQFCDEDL
ncbi:hypothetical protein MTO96_015045 [Rhipicephalus appendiculatus]